MYWDQVITAKTGWFDIKIRELWQYRDLILLFVRRDFVSVYKQTILGPLWYLLQPLLTTITFTVIFGNIAGISTGGMPHMLFYFSGLVMWNYFADCLNKTSNTFINNANLFGKVYFPRLSVPISIVISNLITFAIQFAFFLVFYFYYRIKGIVLEPNLNIFLVPLLILIMAMLGLGVGIIVSSLTTKYRDLRFLVAFGVQLMMYATPVIYPLSTIPEKYKLYILLNPMTPVIETFRYAFLGSGTLDWSWLSYSCAFTVVVFVLGVILFNRIEKNFMDTI